VNRLVQKFEVSAGGVRNVMEVIEDVSIGKGLPGRGLCTRRSSTFRLG
jgi:hypothetical protein